MKLYIFIFSSTKGINSLTNYYISTILSKMEAQQPRVECRPISRDKELLGYIGKIQAKLTDLAESDLLKDEAFRKLSKKNLKVYKQIEGVIKAYQEEIITLKLMYTEKVSQSRWCKQFDPNYHKAQQKSKQEKYKHRHALHKCPCGEIVCCLYKHQKTAKHADGLMRIDFDKKQFTKNKHFKLEKLLMLNAHINWKRYNHTGDTIYDKLRMRINRSKKSFPVFYVIEQGIIRYKIRKS